MNSDPILKKRGRPKKITREATIKSLASLDSFDEPYSKNAFQLEYDKSQYEFLQAKDSQTLILMLKRISHTEKISQEFRAQPILRLLIDSAKELMLNPFEVAVFSIYLDRFGWKDGNLSPHFLFIYIGILSKRFMGCNMIHIHEFYNKKIKNFDESFKQWECSIRNLLEIDIIEINETFRRLTMEGFNQIVNYNYYVDDILQISPPYQIELKDSMKGDDEASQHQESTRKIVNSVETLSDLLQNECSTSTLGQDIYEKIEAICSGFLQASNTQEVQVFDGMNRRVIGNNPGGFIIKDYCKPEEDFAIKLD